jgi:hypothetical protein
MYSNSQVIWPIIKLKKLLFTSIYTYILHIITAPIKIFQKDFRFIFEIALKRKCNSSDIATVTISRISPINKNAIPKACLIATDSSANELKEITTTTKVQASFFKLLVLIFMVKILVHYSLIHELLSLYITCYLFGSQRYQGVTIMTY